MNQRRLLNRHDLGPGAVDRLGARHINQLCEGKRGGRRQGGAQQAMHNKRPLQYIFANPCNKEVSQLLKIQAATKTESL